ncbi:uncharacterized protein LOC116167995 isoform X1 [Photinus pyralis]|uniref:uncharacterized protein LOC116167995 isoform X1 n=1 Tax=Photinus pyralis TaxID=7054 RepID=UPI00126739BE|nr:uncharacterized protein LOC116167995 isoform X1 [Photinus pyralis]
MYVIFQLKVRPSSLAHCRRPMVNTPHIYHTFNHIFVERELRTYLKQKYGSENVAILRGRGVIPDSVKIEEGSFLGRRFQVFKDLELQNTYWVFYIEKCAIIFARSRGKLYVLTVGIFVEQETTIIFGGINPARTERGISNYE